MSLKHELGKKGEELAADYLREQGLRVVETNWRKGRLELDIIAREGEELVFVEVKTRSSGSFGPPLAAIDELKEGKLAAAAQSYMRAVGHDWAIRFDLIGVLLVEGERPVIRHYRDRFFPGSH